MNPKKMMSIICLETLNIELNGVKLTPKVTGGLQIFLII